MRRANHNQVSNVTGLIRWPDPALPISHLKYISVFSCVWKRFLTKLFFFSCLKKKKPPNIVTSTCNCHRCNIKFCCSDWLRVCSVLSVGIFSLQPLRTILGNWTWTWGVSVWTNTHQGNLMPSHRKTRTFPGSCHGFSWRKKNIFLKL